MRCPDLITHYSPCQGLARARVDTEPVSVIFDWVLALAELFITGVTIWGGWGGDTHYDQYRETDSGVTPGAGRETMDVSILRNKLTLELMSHAMAAICFNLYPNGVNSSHLTTLNGSLPPTLFPSVNIYRYSDSLLLCYVENDGDCPKI